MSAPRYVPRLVRPLVAPLLLLLACSPTPAGGGSSVDTSGPAAGSSGGGSTSAADTAVESTTDTSTSAVDSSTTEGSSSEGSEGGSSTGGIAENPACAHFVPGHYIREADSESRGIDGLANISNNLEQSGWDLSVFAGFLVQIDWPMIEPELGEYDFSRTDALLDLMKANGKSLRLKIMDRTFWAGCSPPIPFVPPYVQLVPAVEGPGCFADLWNPATMDGYIALHIALAERYDAEPAFAGFSVEETAIYVDGIAEISPQIYEQRTRLAQELFAAVPSALLISEFNWPLNGDVDQFRDMLDASAVLGDGDEPRNGMGVSWPDSWLDPESYSDDELAEVLPRIQCTASSSSNGKSPCSWYDLGREYNTRTIVAPNIQGGTLTGTLAEADAHYTMLDEDIGAHMITWETWSEPNPNYFPQLALPTVLARGGVLGNTACPFAD